MKWSLAPWERPAILGDLDEEFQELVQRRGSAAARRWYWRQAVFSIWPNLVRRFRGDSHRTREASQAVMYLVPFVFVSVMKMTTPGAARSEFNSYEISSLWAGTLMLWDSLFSKRLRLYRVRAQTSSSTRRQGLVAVVVLLGLTALSVALVRILELSERQLTLVLVVLWFVIFVLPRRVRPRRLFDVRHKLTADLEREALLAVHVQNAPLAVSPLVLCRGSSVEPGSPMHVYDAASDSEFAVERPIRVYAVVNLAAAEHPEAAIEVVNAGDQIVNSMHAAIVHGTLEQTSDRWDDFADSDPAEHFGAIDAVLPMTGIPPGAYRIRVCVTDRGVTSRQEASISLQARRDQRVTPTIRFLQDDTFIGRLTRLTS